MATLYERARTAPAEPEPGSRMQITDILSIPDDELEWSYARSGGPGGQNVNKVASKATLRWRLASNATVPEATKSRLAAQQKRYLTLDGEIVISSQQFRDQERNRQDCLQKLSEILVQASRVPKVRKKTRPSKGSKLRRLQEKKRRSETKSSRKRPHGD